MRNFISAFVIVFSIIFYGCSDGKPGIGFDKMKAIMMDIHIAEVKAVLDDSTKNLNKEKDYKELSEQYAVILTHYSVSKDQFDNALDWYFDHPEVFDSVYKILIADVDSLERKASLDKDNDGVAGTIDSIPDNEKEEMKRERATMLKDPRMPHEPSSTAPQKTRPELIKRPETEIK